MNHTDNSERHLKLHGIFGPIIPYAFMILAATSTVYIIASTINYLGFYPALYQVEPNVTMMTFLKSSGSLLTSLTVKNPSDYSGLRISDALLSTFFLPSNSSNPPLFNQTRLTGTGQRFLPLPPHTIISLNITTSLTPEQFSSLTDYLRVNSNKITSSCVVQVKLSTFLDRQLGYVGLPIRVQNITLTLAD
ncbi:hypothetical protein E6H21_00400 [Candidatus Bathyarchaeota archaeon]|nr:MAG: hypothetical protein E6H21_00400 [Candidatus Bathyarchaeota archaeon]